MGALDRPSAPEDARARRPAAHGDGARERGRGVRRVVDASGAVVAREEANAVKTRARRGTTSRGVGRESPAGVGAREGERERGRERG